SVGADGVLFVCRSERCDVRMRVFNADGSEAEMSGNGVRCFARYVYERGIVRRRRFDVETLGGVVTPEVLEGGAVRVFMGRPSFRMLDEDFYVEGYGRLKLTALSIGNPHAVLVVRSFDEIDVAGLGRAIERHRAFPNGTNVNFVVVDGENEISVRTYERGVGETLSCGTGSTASALALVRLGIARGDRPILVHTRGGDLTVEVVGGNAEGGAYLTGPAEEVFEGRMRLDRLAEVFKS
ncbi:MAG: diaminopimelate epimerase, partial [Candidatus Alkanophagales archaeon]